MSSCARSRNSRHCTLCFFYQATMLRGFAGVVCPLLGVAVVAVVVYPQLGVAVGEGNPMAMGDAVRGFETGLTVMHV